MSAESHRYDPRIHGEPNAFIDALTKDDPKRNLRKSSVLAAAFTPFIRDFQEKMRDYPPSRAEKIREDVEIGRYEYTRSSTDIKGIFDSEIEDPSSYFSYFPYDVESRYLGNHSYDPSRLDSLVVVPIGMYGEQFAKATAMTGSVLSELAGRVMREEQKKLLQSPYGRTIREETHTLTPHTALAEGMQTIAAGIGLLTSEGVPGYDDPIEGVQQLLKQKVFQHFAAQAPSGIIIPMTIVGLRFKEPLTSDDNGHLKINNKFVDLLRKEKLEKVNSSRGRLSEGCPVARPHVPEVTIFGEEDIISDSGVQMGMNIFMEYLKYYYNSEL